MRAATVAGRTTVLTDTGALDVEKTRASRLIFSGRCLVSYLSAITACCPGDLIFDGTPAGVGMARTRPRHLRPGNQVLSRIEGIGAIRQDAAPRAEPCGRTGRNAWRSCQ